MQVAGGSMSEQWVDDLTRRVKRRETTRRAIARQGVGGVGGAGAGPEGGTDRAALIQTVSSILPWDGFVPIQGG
jgi:nicotinamide mononucleotide (NMN) deamidase PncC